ncbi:DUF3073 domain-containing protein [Ornithinimicrobium cerasi]|uniref:DUF3073 domain-containing protein n=1 Tax=Ornithinimicrobium cerasi TaxID=2248773 RepID=A0A285VT67_9MICO|nr:DUF3073 domain-containing protein [Ornithinimicrobium cerasi]SOC57242.1 Protein of unknown function [Ornithinimicrobium cerasi]
MGRGRAKAKQIKVARKLKYNSGPSTDLTALEKELHGSSVVDDDFTAEDDDEDEDDDPYAAYAAADDEDDYGSWAGSAPR